jgi:hypothetical protein
VGERNGVRSIRGAAHPLIRFPNPLAGLPRREDEPWRRGAFLFARRDEPARTGTIRAALVTSVLQFSSHHISGGAGCAYKTMRQHHPKPLIPVTVVGIVIVAIRTADIPIIIVERTTTNDAALAIESSPFAIKAKRLGTNGFLHNRFACRTNL